MRRNGFVSNSSSSSFILAVRLGHAAEEFSVGDLVGIKHAILDFIRGKSLCSLAQIVHDGLCWELGPDYATKMKFNGLLNEDVAEIVEHITHNAQMVIGEGEKLDNWQFYTGEASYNAGDEEAENLSGNGLGIQSENVRLG